MLATVYPIVSRIIIEYNSKLVGQYNLSCIIFPLIFYVDLQNCWVMVFMCLVYIRSCEMNIMESLMYRKKWQFPLLCLVTTNSPPSLPALTQSWKKERLELEKNEKSKLREGGLFVLREHNTGEYRNVQMIKALESDTFFVLVLEGR